MLISIDGEYVPRVGDEVSFRKLPLPPKMEKFQAVHVQVHKCREETLLLLIFITHHLNFNFRSLILRLKSINVGSRLSPTKKIVKVHAQLLQTSNSFNCQHLVVN